jgi:hypothetical protein
MTNAEPAGTGSARRAWWLWPVRLAAAAAFPLAVVAAFQALVVVPRLREEIAARDRPRALTPRLLRPMTRGTVPIIAADGEPFVPVQLVVPEPVARAYRTRLLDLDGQPVQSFGEVAIAAAPAGEAIQLLMPIASLPAGHYTIEITPEDPGRESSAHRYQFLVEPPTRIP